MRKSISRVAQMGDFNRRGTRVRADFEGYLAKPVRIENSNFGSQAVRISPSMDGFFDDLGNIFANTAQDIVKQAGDTAVASVGTQVLSQQAVQQAIQQQAEKSATQKLAEQLRLQGQNMAAFYQQNKTFVWIGAGLLATGLVILLVKRK